MGNPINQIKEILREPIELEKKYRKLEKLGEDIAARRMQARFSKEHGVDDKRVDMPSPQEIGFQEFIYVWILFYNWQYRFPHHFPFQAWANICQEGLGILNKMIEVGTFEGNQVPGYR